MKYLIKTDNYQSIGGGVDYDRVIYDSTNDKVYCQKKVEPKAVDLGLPSKLLWAECNVGASTPEEGGLYFQWGDTQGYTAEQVGKGEGQKAFDWSDYKFSIDGSDSNFSKYNGTDGKTTLDLDDDAAHANMGGNWRTPTRDDFKELIFNTDIYLVAQDRKEFLGTAKEQDGTIKITWKNGPSLALIKGTKFYKKGDKETFIFIPPFGYVTNGKRAYTGYQCSLSTSSLAASRSMDFWDFSTIFSEGSFQLQGRHAGTPIRGVLAQ